MCMTLCSRPTRSPRSNKETLRKLLVLPVSKNYRYLPVVKSLTCLVGGCRDSLACDIMDWNMTWPIDMWHDSSSCHTITFASRAIAIVQSLKMTHWPWRLTRLIDLWHDALKYDMPRWNVTWLIYMLTNHLHFARNRRSKIIDMTDWWLRDSLARDMMHWNMTCFVDMWHDSSTCWLIIFSSRAIAVVKSLIWLIDVLHDLCEMMRWNVTWLIDIWPNDMISRNRLKTESYKRDLWKRPTN